MPETKWPIESVTQNNPLGPDLDDVPVLLRRFADTIESLGEVDVMDIVHHIEIRAEGYWHSLTAYYNRNPESVKASRWAPASSYERP